VQQAHGGRDINKLVEGAEAYLQKNPDDGKAWALLAPVYLRLNQGDKAANAFRRAIALNGANATLEIGLGEAIVSAEGGKVGTDAQAAFQRALGHDPAAVEPRFFLAVALNQEQKFPEAVVAWEAFLKDADPREPWVPYARAELAKARKGAGLPPAAEMPPMAAAPVAPMAPSPTAPSPTAPSPAAPGPTADDVAAAQDMTQEDRQSMIESMVARLAERLETEGGGAEDWIRLMRAYMVLNRKDDARSAALKAIEAHKDDSAAKAQIENAASGLGIVL